MDFQNSNLFISYKYLSAKNPNQLEKQMLQIQVDNKKPVTFSAPIYNPNSKIYECWYLHDFSKDIRPKEKLDIGTK